METTDIVTELRNVIRTKFKIPESDCDFNDEVHLFDYGYIDSFGAVELTTFVKTRFAIEVTESDMVVCPLNSIKEIAAFVACKQKGTA